MCKEYRWVITVASVSGMVQSLLWLAFGISGVLVYLCLIPVARYESSNDFFKVTLIKLYFEGPRCRLNGSYLGPFEEDRMNVQLFTQDLVFGVMVAFVVLDAIYFAFSVAFYKYRKSDRKRGIAVAWSLLSLTICAVDALVTLLLVCDVLSLKLYTSRESENLPPKLEELPYIPLTLALFSSRFIAGWLWNFFLGITIFLDALCCRNIIRKKVVKPVVKEKPQSVMPKPVEKPAETTVSPINGKEKRDFDIFENRDFSNFSESMETSTRFNIQEKPPSTKGEGSEKAWSYTASEGFWHPKPHSSKAWEMANDAYETDEEEKKSNFDHDLRNFEPGQRKIKIVKPTPPLGKPSGRPVDKMNSSEGNRSLETHT